MHEEGGLHIQLASERLFELWGALPITNSILTAWAVMLVLFLIAFLVRRNLNLIPGKLQNVVEMGYEFVYGYVEQTLGDKKLAQRYFPLIATIFFFILFSNMFDFLPIFGTLTVMHGEEAIPLFHAVNADLNTTLALAIIVFVVIELSGILTLGVLKYGSKFVNFKGGFMMFVVGLLELIGNLARLISFSFRLFGAIFAGEVLLLVIGSFVPYLLPVPLMAFEMFIGLLQAAIFAILTLAFIKIAIAEPHGAEHHEKGAEAGAH
jgi:F-type H+-transporting ATPase subunit a